MEQDSLCYRDILNNQIQESYGKVVYTHTGHLKMAEILFSQRTIFKWAQLILSGISAVGIISILFVDEFWVELASAIIAFCLFVLTAYFKDADLSGRHQMHMKSANALWSVREKYLTLLTDFNELDSIVIRERRDFLQHEVEKIYADAPLINNKAFRKAQSELKHKEVQFFTQEELDLMLPKKLRKSDKYKNM